MSNNTTGCLPALFCLFVLVPVNALIQGFTLFKYWVWFVLPAGGPNIGFWNVLGLTSMLAYITFNPPNNDNDYMSWGKVWENEIMTVMLAGLFLLFGWVYMSLM